MKQRIVQEHRWCRIESDEAVKTPFQTKETGKNLVECQIIEDVQEKIIVQIFETCYCPIWQRHITRRVCRRRRRLRCESNVSLCRQRNHGSEETGTTQIRNSLDSAMVSTDWQVLCYPENVCENERGAFRLTINEIRCHLTSSAEPQRKWTTPCRPSSRWVKSWRKNRCRLRRKIVCAQLEKYDHPLNHFVAFCLFGHPFLTKHNW